MMNLQHQEISPEIVRPEFEASEELTEEEKRLTANKAMSANIITHLNEYKEFYQSDYALQTRKERNIGFNKSEKFDILNIAAQIQEFLNEIVSDNNIDIPSNNHFDHLLGNSTVVLAGGKAIRYDKRKPILFDHALMAKRQLENLNFFIEEAVKDKKLLEKELSSPVGYMDNFLRYIKCDLPSDSQAQLQLFKFFRELERGAMQEDDFWPRAEKLSGFIDLEALKTDLTEDKVFKTYSLKNRNQKSSGTISQEDSVENTLYP